MEQLGLSFSVVVNKVEEDIQEVVTPARLVELLSMRKAEKAAEELTEGLVIASDTIVVWKERIMGKPGNRQDAMDMLGCLQGDQHSVFSGLAVLDVKTGKSHLSWEETKVFFRVATAEEIELYVDSGEPFGKAGAYAIQGLGAVFVTGIIGCYFNVVGLPVSRLSRVLKDFGVDILCR